MREIESELASVELVARRAGADIPLEEVRVRIDGIEHKAEAGRVLLEPGTHRIQLAYRGDTVTHDLDLSPGPRAQPLISTFGVRKEPAPVVDPDPPDDDGGDNGATILTWLLVGVGGAAVTAAAVLAINGHVLRSDLVDSCAPACEPDSIKPIERQWIAAGALAGAGGSMLLCAAIVAATTSNDSPSVSLTLRGRF
jgi:hypothetical protein